MACQLSVIEYGCASLIEKSRTLNVGLKIAFCNAQPRDTASSAFNVVLGSIPKTFCTRLLTAGTLDDPPTISTAVMSDVDNSEKD